jgi:protocatechuate 3,4-dioxygenase beta subunit
LDLKNSILEINEKIHILFIVISCLVLCVFTASCGVAPENDTLSSLETDNSTISLAPADEPGQQLMLFGTVIDSQTGEPIPNTQVYLYHADATGEYNPSDPEDESTARLSGEAITNDAGEFTVDTIVPREYDQPGNRHIHLHYVRAEGYQDGGGVILFEKDVNDEIRQWAIDTGFGTIIELRD